MTMGRAILVFCAAAGLAGGGYLASYWYPLAGPVSDTGTPTLVSALPASPIRIELQGRLEPVSGTLALGALPGEEIVELLARTGQHVAQGDILAVLGSRALRRAELVLAQRQLEKAKNQFEAEQTLARLRQDMAEIAQLQAEAKAREIPPEESIRVAEERETLAAARLERLEQLRQDPRSQDAIADAELEQQRLLLRQIQLDLQQSRSQLEVARQMQELSRRAADLDVALARALQDQLVTATPLPVLEQSVELAQLAEEAAVVRAPSDGTILEVYARQGERVANTPILQLGDLRHMVCIAELHEANMKELVVQPVSDAPEQGQRVPARHYRVTIRSAALAQDLEGRIVEVGQLIGAPALRDPNPLAPTDRRTVKMRIELDESSTEIARRFVHLQVNVTVHLQETERAGP